MIELSLDNETLATTHDAVVLTIGAVLFEGERVIETAHLKLDIDAQLLNGRKVSGSTIEWWLSQGEDAKKGLAMATPVVLSTAYATLREFGSKAEQVWARPGMFDLPMLRHLLGQDLWDDVTPKWPNHGYQKERDLGTLIKELKMRGTEPQFIGVPHNALDDAMHHFRWLNAIRRALDTRVPPAWSMLGVGDGAGQNFVYGPHEAIKICQEIMLRKAWEIDKSMDGGNIWTCKIGEFGGELPPASDGPMRDAVFAAYKKLTGQDANYCFSGWGGRLSVGERGVVEGGNRGQS